MKRLPRRKIAGLLVLILTAITLSPLAAELSWLGVAVILVVSLPIFRDIV